MNKQSMYLTALSGGADSVALLNVLLELGYKVEAVHCNFHLRGEESYRDENFCRTLCKAKNIALHLASFDTISYAQLHKISIEMAARELRYHYFAQLCDDLKAGGICVGHHSDDQIETVLLNIIRGTGIKGLTGMKPKNGIVIRPLLTVSRKQILAYLNTIAQEFVTDSSNFVDDVQRNKVRLDLIPMLERINPAVQKNIIHMTENLAEVQDAIDADIKEAQHNAVVKDLSLSNDKYEVVYNIDRLMAYPSPKLLIWNILSIYSFNRHQVGEIVDLTKKVINSNEGALKLWKSQNHVALVHNRRICIIKRKLWEYQFSPQHIPETGLYKFGNLTCRIDELTDNQLNTVSRAASRITIDGSRVQFPLILRQVRNGDKFTPYGLKGHKLVSDFLKDAHIDPVTRKQQLVLADSSDRILWLVGLRIDDHYKIVTNKTKKILQIEIKQNSDCLTNSDI